MLCHRSHQLTSINSSVKTSKIADSTKRTYLIPDSDQELKKFASFYSNVILYGVLKSRKRPLGRPRRRWEDNIKMDLQGVGGGGGDWMELAQDRYRWRALVSRVR